jgi:hypothetical protein
MFLFKQLLDTMMTIETDEGLYILHPSRRRRKSRKKRRRSRKKRRSENE